MTTYSGLFPGVSCSLSVPFLYRSRKTLLGSSLPTSSATILLSDGVSLFPPLPRPLLPLRVPSTPDSTQTSRPVGPLRGDGCLPCHSDHGHTGCPLLTGRSRLGGFHWDLPPPRVGPPPPPRPDTGEGPPFWTRVPVDCGLLGLSSPLCPVLFLYRPASECRWEYHLLRP